ncbi:MAG: ABC transporter permease [Ruminococcus sp.]|nr:ABC transporter permease [Ruminococcus sp.]
MTQTAAVKPAAREKGDDIALALPAKKSREKLLFTLSALFTAAGFAAAILVNLYFPQKAEIRIKDYILTIAGLAIRLDQNDAYRFLLAALIALYTGIAVFSAFRKDRRRKFAKRAPFRFACGIALALWDIAGTKLQTLPQPFFPGPSQVMGAYLADGDYILLNTRYSLRLYFAGFSCGVILGVLTGILIGWFPKVYYWVFPVLKITGVVPAVAWMPFALTLLPTSFTAAVFLIVICAWFQIAFLTAQGIRSTPKQNYEAAKILGSGQIGLILHVAIPHAVPDIFTGITSANAMAFTTLVMSEMLGQPGGLGYYINQSKVWSAYYKVLAAIVIMAVLFSLINFLIGLVQKRALRWQEGVLKK